MDFLVNQVPGLRERIAAQQAPVVPAPSPQAVALANVLRQQMAPRPVQRPQPVVQSQTQLAAPIPQTRYGDTIRSVGGSQPQQPYRQPLPVNPAQAQMAAAGIPQPQLSLDPLYAELVASGATPIQAMELVRQQGISNAQQQQHAAVQQQLVQNAPADPLISAAQDVPGAVGTAAHGVQTAGQAVADAELAVENFSPGVSGVAHGVQTVAGNLGNIPLFSTPGGSATVGEVVGQPDRTAAALIGNPISAIYNNVPGAKTVMDLYQKPYNWATERTGEDIYDVATTGRMPNFSNPYFYLDSTIEGWSQNAANKQKIVAAHDVGLDLNGDGQIDVKGAEAVWLAYMTENHPGFIDNLITQMGYDPLFAVSAVAPAATGVRTGAEVGIDALRPFAEVGALSKTQRIQQALLQATEKLATGTERVGDVGNAVADAPFTLTVGAARKINEVLPPWLQKAVDTAAGPAGTTTVNRTVNAAEDAADSAQAASDVPTYSTVGPTKTTPDMLPERGVSTAATPDFIVGPGGNIVPGDSDIVPVYDDNLLQIGPGQLTTQADIPPKPIVPREPSPSVGPIPLESGEIQPTVTTSGSTFDGKPSRNITVDGKKTHRVITGKSGYEVQEKGANGRFTTVGDPHPTIEAAERAAVELAGGPPSTVQEPTVSTTAAVPEEQVAPDQPTMTEQETLAESAPPEQVTTAGPDNTAAQIAELDAKIAAWEEKRRIARSGKGERLDATVGDANSALKEYRQQRDDLLAQSAKNVPEQPIQPETPISPTRTMESLTDEERVAAIKDPNSPVTELTPRRGDGRFISKVRELGDSDPAAWSRFAERFKPHAAEFIDNLKAIDTEIAEIDAAIKKPLPGERRPWIPQEQRDAYFARRNQLVHDANLLRIKNTVEQAVPLAVEEFRVLPDVVPSVPRNKATTGSGKASWKTENTPYLMQRYVYEDFTTKGMRDASGAMENLRAREGVGNQPWWPEMEAELTRLRGEMQKVRGAAETQGPPLFGSQAAGIIVNPQERARQLYRATNDLGDRVFGTSDAIPSFADGVMDEASASERFLADDYTGIQSKRGAISPEDKAFLDTRVRSYKIKTKGKWVDATPREVQAWADKHPTTNIPESGSFKFATIRGDDITQLDLLNQITEAMPDATSHEISHAFGNRVTDLTGVRPDPRKPMSRWVERIRSGAADIRDIGRESAIYNVVTGPRGAIQDTLSDALRDVMEGQIDSIFYTGTEFIRRLRGLESVGEQISNEYGLKVPPKIRVNKGRTEVTAEGRTATNRAISDRLGFEEGSRADRITGVATGLTNSRIMRDGRNGMDNAKREATYVNYIETHEHDVLRAFNQRGRLKATQHGILPTSFDAYLNDLGRRFSVEDVRGAMKELADDAGLPADYAVSFADNLADDWRHSIGKMRNDASKEVDRVRLSYERTKLDETLGNFIFYHYWMSRAIPAYARIALRNPEIAAMWMRGWEDIKDRAEKSGYPDSMKGYIRFMGSPAGWNFAMHPLGIIMPLADMMPSAQEDATLYEQITQFVAVNPVISYAAAALGLTDDVSDPLMSYSVRNMVLAGVNKLRAERGDDPYRDPYEMLLRKSTEFANKFGAKLPFGKTRVYADPQTFNQSEIQYNLAEIIARETGVPTDQWVVDGPEFQRYVSAINDNAANIDNPDYDAARQEWADAELQGRTLNSAIPGGVRTRYGPRDEVLTTGFEDRSEQQQTFKNIVESANPESAGLTLADEEYHAIGTERQQSMANDWADIAYGNDEIPDDWVVNLGGGATVTMGQLKELDDDQRRQIADAWVATFDGTEELADYREEQSAFKDAHPEYKTFTDWSSDARRDWEDKGGLTAFRENRAAGNPNFKREMDDYERFLKEVKGITDPKLLSAELDQWSVSLAGYMAAQGIRNDVYDQQPRSTGDQATVDALRVAMDQSGGFTSSSGKAKTTADKLKNDITEFQKDSAVVEGLLKSYGIDLGPGGFANVHSPYALTSLGGMLGDLMPKQTALMKQYGLWASYQPKGSDTSPEAFGTYLDKLAAEDALAEVQSDYQPGGIASRPYDPLNMKWLPGSDTAGNPGYARLKSYAPA
jgi:hypothetical protein